MRYSTLILSALVLVMAGCGSKDAATTDNAGQTPSTSTPSSTAGTSTQTAQSSDTSDLKSKIIGDWTMKNTQGNTNVEGDISIREDGTFTNAGKVSGETPGEDGTVKMTISYSIDGKWTLDGDNISTTPDKIDTHVDDIEIKTKDPANQAKADAQKDEVAKKAEEQTKESLNKPSSVKVESATADELHLAQASGVKIVYTRKK